MFSLVDLFHDISWIETKDLLLIYHGSFIQITIEGNYQRSCFGMSLEVRISYIIIIHAQKCSNKAYMKINLNTIID